VNGAYKPELARTIIVRNPEDFPLVKVKNDYARLVYNLGAPRLGGPIRHELGPGTVLKTSGKIGSNYRIRLSNTETGFISEDDIEVMDGNRVQSTVSPACHADRRQPETWYRFHISSRYLTRYILILTGNGLL
jgi:hypothetical protein